MSEIESLAELDRAVARARAGSGSMSTWEVQGLDLTSREDALDGLEPRGALFLGCTISDETADRLRDGGALVFPDVPDVPFDPWRAHLYTPRELYADLDHGYQSTLDARIHAWSRRARGRHDLSDLLAKALHDRSVEDALEEMVTGRHVVGVMGGHALERDDTAYAHAARLGQELARRGHTVATGGGPGAMEAANLGARLADEPRARLDRVIATLATVPSFESQVTTWARTGFEAVEGLPDSGRSLGIPTWFYGHEPPNPFCSAIAKYFRNALREEVLLQVGRAGIVFLPGAAGTVQEIFAAVCANYYAGDDVAPMVFVGERHWNDVLPVWPLVRAMAGDRPFATTTSLVDDVAEVPDLIDR